MANAVTLLGFWASPFGMRVKIALAEKEVNYEYKEEDLRVKSETLLKMNPIHKKIPILVHNNKPVCESLIIVEYIDEVWSDKYPLLPSDHYQRAQARLWADFSEKKIYETGKRVWTTKGEEQEAAKKELLENLKLLDNELGDKPYFGGDKFGYVDVSLIPFNSWFYTFETIGNFKVEESCPKITEWAKRCMQRETVAKSLEDPKKIYEFVMEIKKMFGI